MPGVPDARLSYAPGSTPRFWSVAAADTIIARYPIRQAYWKDWTYVNGYVLLGIEQVYRATGDAKYLDFIKKYVHHFVDERGRFRGGKLSALDNWIDPSGTAMFVYSICRGVELGLLDKAEYEPIAERGYRGTLHLRLDQRPRPGRRPRRRRRYLHLERLCHLRPLQAHRQRKGDRWRVFIGGGNDGERGVGGG